MQCSNKITHKWSISNHKVRTMFLLNFYAMAISCRGEQCIALSVTNCAGVGFKHFSVHCEKATIHQVTSMLATSTKVLFPGQNHLLTTGTDDLTFDNCPSAKHKKCCI